METWDSIRDRILARDGRRCTVSRLIGGGCKGDLHVHHIVPRDEGGTDEDDNLGTTCARHHPMWEALRAAILEWRERANPRRRCHHSSHRYPGAREACERRLNRERQVAVV